MINMEKESTFTRLWNDSVGQLGKALQMLNKLPVQTPVAVQLIVSALLFVYLFADDFQSHIPDNGFGIYILTARALIFFNAVFFGLASLSYVFSSCYSRIADFAKKYQVFLENFIHTALAINIIALGTIFSESQGREAESQNLILFLALGFSLLLKVLLDVKHSGEVGSKHARGPALTISIALLMYAFVTTEQSAGWSDLFSSLYFIFLIAYIVLVALEKTLTTPDKEFSVGGVTVVDIISYLLLWFTGHYVGEQGTADSVVIALGVVLLDSMHIGAIHPMSVQGLSLGLGEIGPQVKEPKEAWNPKEASLYRLVQVGVGILAFTLITRQNPADEQPVVNPMLYGVALASALVKVAAFTYMGKAMLLPSPEHNYRSLASTGLLVVSMFLWSGGHFYEHDTISQGWAITFFILALLLRFLDSLTESVFVFESKDKGLLGSIWEMIKGSLVSEINGDDVLGMTAGYRDALYKATGDNPRVWLVLASLIGSLIFSAMVIDEKSDHLDDDDTLAQHLWAAVILTSLHVFVVLAAILASVMKPLNYLAWSRSGLVRFVVSTSVIASLTVSASTFNFGSGSIDTGSADNHIVFALILYIFADALGDGLL